MSGDRGDEIRQEAKAKYLDRTGELYRDVELIVRQIGCTEDVAVKALVAQEGDIVNAIMVLTMDVE